MSTYTKTVAAGGSSTAVMEMHDLQAPHSKLEAPPPPDSESSPQEDPVDPGSPPPVATELVQRWNYPKGNVPKIGACFWSFIVMGANDAAYGVSRPVLLTYSVISSRAGHIAPLTDLILGYV